MKELLLGCGNSRLKRFAPSRSAALNFQDVLTVDNDPRSKPDITWDLNVTPWPFARDDEFDEVHAYEVLEHLGQQGDFISYFRVFSEIWRVLKPDGFLCASTPSMGSRWAWGDPGHTRIVSPETLTFLDQTEYAKQVGVTAMSDYRYWYKADFQLTGHKDDGEAFMFIAQAIKPSRIIE